jgi:hypothetical protein
VDAKACTTHRKPHVRLALHRQKAHHRDCARNCLQMHAQQNAARVGIIAQTPVQLCAAAEARIMAMHTWGPPFRIGQYHRCAPHSPLGTESAICGLTIHRRCFTVSAVRQSLPSRTYAIRSAAVSGGPAPRNAAEVRQALAAAWAGPQSGPRGRRRVSAATGQHAGCRLIGKERGRYGLQCACALGPVAARSAQQRQWQGSGTTAPRVLTSSWRHARSENPPLPPIPWPVT